MTVGISLAQVRPDDFDAACAVLVKERVNGVVFLADPMGLRQEWRGHAARLQVIETARPRLAPARLPNCAGGDRQRVLAYFLSSVRIQTTSLCASPSLIATSFGGIARPLTLPFQWLA